MYNGLIEQFNSKYEEEEKNLLFLYKSKIGIAINSLNKNADVVNDIYEYYKKVLTNPKNMFMNFTVFKDISLDSLESFRESLEIINKKIEPLLSKLETEEPITVYRMISVKKDDETYFLSKENIISTSIDMEECLKFYINDEDYNHYLYQINLPKNSKVAICPYTIGVNTNNDQLILTTRKDQKEVILNKKLYDFKYNNESEIVFSEKTTIKVISLDAKEKINSKQESRKI